MALNFEHLRKVHLNWMVSEEWEKANIRYVCQAKESNLKAFCIRSIKDFTEYTKRQKFSHSDSNSHANKN